jgi:hypothetical protein
MLAHLVTVLLRARICRAAYRMTACSRRSNSRTNFHEIPTCTLLRSPPYSANRVFGLRLRHRQLRLSLRPLSRPGNHFSLLFSSNTQNFVPGNVFQRLQPYALRTVHDDGPVLDGCPLVEPPPGITGLVVMVGELLLVKLEAPVGTVDHPVAYLLAVLLAVIAQYSPGARASLSRTYMTAWVAALSHPV